jgi:asparagine synthase (glutamine-hydrolysing)
MEQAEKIPAEYKVNEIDTKYVLRQAANKTLPDAWANRKKAGFPTPIRHWLKEEKFYSHVKRYFDAPWAAEFFDTTALHTLLDDHYAGRANNGRKIWTVFTFLVWYERFFVME